MLSLALFKPFASIVTLPPLACLSKEKKQGCCRTSTDLPFQLSPDDVYITIGCTQSKNIIISVLARPGTNILLPRPGYPQYEARASCNGLEVRHFDLLPERGWDVDINSLEALADENTVAVVIINPSNPCGNVFTYKQSKRVAETARKLRIFVVADEVYAHMTFGNNPFVPMGVFASIVPVITLGSLGKRWLVPGWSLGWIVTCDPNGILHKTGVHFLDLSVCLRVSVHASYFIFLNNESKQGLGGRVSYIRYMIADYAENCDFILSLSGSDEYQELSITTDTPTIMQAAIPQIL